MSRELCLRGTWSLCTRSPQMLTDMCMPHSFKFVAFSCLLVDAFNAPPSITIHSLIPTLSIHDRTSFPDTTAASGHCKSHGPAHVHSGKRLLHFCTISFEPAVADTTHSLLWLGQEWVGAAVQAVRP